MMVVAALIAVVVALLLFDLVFFARGREPSFRESAAWSIGWFMLGIAVALPLWAIDGGDGAVNYLTVYLIERTLSLDNLFVFLLIFGAFAVPHQHRGKLLFWGIALALVARGVAILVGVELIERFHWIIYALGVTLLVLAWRILRGAHENADPGQGRTARFVRRMLPVSEHYHGARFLAREDGRLVATPMVLALAGVVTADIVRGRLDPRRVRDHDRRAGHLDGECVRAPGPARAVLAGRGAHPALSLPRRDDRRRAGHRRGQTADRGPLQGRADRQPGGRARRLRGRDHRVDPARPP
jgi:hypothetical protein